MSKIGVVGAGFVGSTAAYAMMLNGVCNELILIDADPTRAEAEASDIAHGAPLSHGCDVWAGDYADLVGTNLVVVCAGSNQKPGESRLDLLARNASIFKQIIPQIVKYAPEAVVLIASNPVDIMTAVSKALHPNPKLVLGSGTILDSARFRQLIAQKAQVNARHVHAYVVGEHGDSSVLCWSSALIAGLNVPTYMKERGLSWSEADVKEIEQGVRGAAGAIIAGKRATYYGVGVALAKLADTIIHDRRAIYAVSGNNPIDDFVCTSLPCIVGKGGIQATLMSQLDREETMALAKSTEILLHAQESILKDGKLII